MTTVVGVDSSTQSTKVVVCDADTGAVLAEGRAGHPDTTEIDPAVWWAALHQASRGLLDGVSAVAVSAQQHGMVALDSDGDVVRPALLWNDTRSAVAAADLVDALGGGQAWADRVGSVPVASFTVSKLSWLAHHEPVAAARTQRVLLPHDWLTWQLLDRPATTVTDRGDASGTGYWCPWTGDYDLDLVDLALGHAVDLPEPLPPRARAGVTAAGAVLAAGTGDNMGAALGLGAAPGDVVVSLGTSGTVFAVSETPTRDGTGTVAGFADATGRFLPLVCTLNAARVLTAAADLLGTDLVGLDRLALRAGPGAGGLVLLPYLDGERTPNLPGASGTLYGLTRANATPENVARAAVEGMLCGLADGLDAVRAQGVAVDRVLLVGGAARSRAVRVVARDLFGVPVTVPAAAQWVARGAARQAAWALNGGGEPPPWRLPEGTDVLETPDPATGEAVRSAYAAARSAVHGPRVS